MSAKPPVSWRMIHDCRCGHWIVSGRCITRGSPGAGCECELYAVDTNFWAVLMSARHVWTQCRGGLDFSRG